MLYGPKDNGLQFVFEATNAAFVGGGCDKRRVANAKLGKLQTPTEGNADITVIAGWALGYDNVKITPAFTLIPGVAEVKETKKVPKNPTDAGTERREEGGNREEQRSAPAAFVEPIKLNLRGGKTPALTPDAPAPPAVDTPPVAQRAAVQQSAPVKSAPVKLSVAPKAAAMADPSEPEGAALGAGKPDVTTPGAATESELQREARLAAEIRAVAAAAAAAEAQAAQAAEASAAAQRDADAAEAARKAAADADRKAALEAAEAAAEMDRKAAVQAAMDAAAMPRDAPSAAVDAAVDAKKQKIQLEDLDQLDAGEDVDAAIEKMQAMIKEMKKKKAAKDKDNVPSASDVGEEKENGNGKKVKGKVQKVERKKGKVAAKGITLDVGGKKGASGSAKEGVVLKVASTRKNRNAAGGEVPAEDADGEVETETENGSEGDAEEAEGEEKPQEKTSEVRLRRSKRKSELPTSACSFFTSNVSALLSVHLSSPLYNSVSAVWGSRPHCELNSYALFTDFALLMPNHAQVSQSPFDAGRTASSYAKALPGPPPIRRAPCSPPCRSCW